MKHGGIKEQKCDVCRKMWQLGWVAANDGVHKFIKNDELLLRFIREIREKK